MRAFSRLLVAAITFAAALIPGVGRAQETAPSSQVAWRLLDYLAVDYSGAVANGSVVSQSEYAEMQEFSASVRERLAALPNTSAQAGLVAQADELVAAIAHKASPQDVAVRAHRLAADLLVAYPTPLAPFAPPDLARGAALYAEQCSACHGATGHGDGPNARGLNPQPVAFADAARARQRSVFGLYQVIGQGLDGTAMASFAHLPSDDRWALAFYVGSFAFDESAADHGKQLWNTDAQVRAHIPDLQTLTQTTPATLSTQLGEPNATQIVAYLRRHPEAVFQRGDTLGVARAKLAQSVASYESGDRRGAQELALSAYLDGFEPVEPTLAARDRALLTRIEGAMGAFRASLSAGAPVSEIRAQSERINALLDAADRALAPQHASAVSSFAGAFTILLREGLEALLIVVAMIAFLGKADRRDVLPYVHGGWVSALAAGVLTWAAATSLISISGASRELTEGFGSLISAIVLISVGIWMHGKGQSDAWQTYIKEKLSTALSRGSAWFLFLLAFMVVYREVFETILFYVALWSQGAHFAMLAGAATAALALVLIGWGLLSYSKRLPISQFFSYSSILIAVLAIVLAGKGFAALQEAGLLDIHPLALIPRVEVLGLFPTWEGFLAQALTLATILVGFWFNGRQAVPKA
jgi:high-affinity iron transporter